MGHTIDQCSRDPNLRTATQTEEDFDRIKKIKEFKKLHVDTVVNTTHFIKKSVMVPYVVDDDGQIHASENSKNPFCRGIMEFDDFNYKQFNDFVLIEDPKGTNTENMTKAQVNAKPFSGKNSSKSNLITYQNLDKIDNQ